MDSVRLHRRRRHIDGLVDYWFDLGLVRHNGFRFIFVFLMVVEMIGSVDAAARFRFVDGWGVLVTCVDVRSWIVRRSRVDWDIMIAGSCRKTQGNGY